MKTWPWKLCLVLAGLAACAGGGGSPASGGGGDAGSGSDRDSSSSAAAADSGGSTRRGSTGGSGTGGSGTGGSKNNSFGSGSNGCYVPSLALCGECQLTSDCTAPDVATSGYCPGADDVQCCTSANSISTSGMVVTTTPPPTNPDCLQGAADNSVAPAAIAYIYPRNPVTPFYQWESNDGYCGEVAALQADMNNGQWLSQLNSRAICGAQGNGHDAPIGTALSQSGPDGFCAAQNDTPDDNCQFLLENQAEANPAICLSNSRLSYETWDYTTAGTGMSAYQSFMSWIKAQTIAGNQVGIAVDIASAGDTGPYDHIVSVMAIGTNHCPTDPSYYDDDVLFIEDHGAFNTTGVAPSIPPGTGGTTGCTPYVFGYAFSALPASRAACNSGSQFYCILIPGQADMPSYTNGDGVDLGPPETGYDYGFAVTGVADTDGTTLPVVVSLVGSTTSGAANPRDPLAGYNYENPYIGSAQGTDCTNVTPTAMGITLEVVVTGLTAGASYNLYEYDFDAISGVGAAAALAVPTASFNGKASMASSATHFVASGTTFRTTVNKTAFQTVVFRAVSASAP